jgi:YVTN family beta-propeller protein
MPRFRCVRGVAVLVLAGALVGVVPDGVSAVATRSRCRATAFVANTGSGTVSTIDVKTRTKNPTDLTVGTNPIDAAITPDGKTAFVANNNYSRELILGGDSVSTIDVKTRTKHPTDITVGSQPQGVAMTPDGKTAFVANGGSGTVSTIDVKTRAKHPTDIPVGDQPFGVAFTPSGKTAFVPNRNSHSVSTIDVKTRTKHPTDIPVGSSPVDVAFTPDRKTAFVTNWGSGSVSTIDVKTRSKDPTDVPVGSQPIGLAVTPCRR